MCLGIPGEIVDVRDDAGLRIGRVRFAGITRDVCLDYLPDAAVGEFVVVHVGFAIARIDREAAERAYRTLEEIGQTLELTSGADPPEEHR
jgi:hydrogenase expression/formation protein HypC